MAEPHQPPYPLPQQQQGMAAWYGVPPHTYQAQQAPAPPMQHHTMPWSVAPGPPPPPGEQAYSYMSQQYHPPPQSDFYPPPQQVHHQYPPPPQPAQPQFTYMYGQQDQVWQANNSWGYQQWPYPAQNASLSQEEVWAAKARAWAASKSVQEEPRPGSNASQMYQDYMYQSQEAHPSEGQQHSLQPPGQEAGNVPYYQNTMISQGQNGQARTLSEHPPQSLSYDQPIQDIAPSVTPGSSVLESLDQKAAQGGGQLQPNDIQSVFSSSHVHDAAASYKLDNAISGPPGSDRLDPIPQPPPKQLPAAPMYTQPATHLLPQSQASPLISQPRLTYSDRMSPAGYEHQQQQASSNYLQPLPHQQPLAQVQHQLPKVPFQPHYQSLVTTEGVEGEFGLSPGSLQNWAPVGGPGMPFPPAMGAGNSQFDPLHTPHQIPGPWRPDGTGLQGLGFPTSAPFGVGSSPGLVPGAGAPVRPLFAPDSYIERPKKAAVPSWLREEIMKKKAAGLAGNATGMLLSDESSRGNGGEPAIPLSQRVGISDKLRSSTPGLSEDEEEDEEEEIEAARNAAINQEIKRLLTEVLLKVTGDLFEEIAQEVLDEDDNDILQGKSSPDERSKVAKLTSPRARDTTPPLSGRVFVSSVKNPDAGDSDKDKESSDSGMAAGDVLGLGNYASDEETLGSKDYQEPLHSLETKTEKYESRPLDSVDQRKSREKADSHGGDVAGGPLQSMELVEIIKHAKENDTSEDNTRSPIVKQEKEEWRQQDVRKPQLQEEDNNLSSVRVHHLDAQNGRSPVRKELGISITQTGLSTMKDHIRPHSSVNYDDHRLPLSSKSSVMERNNSALKNERQHHDKDQPSSNAGTNRSDEKLENKEIGLNQDTIVKDKRKEEKGGEKEFSSKERKREEKPKIKSDISSKEKNSEEREERRKPKSDMSGKERNTDERTKDNKEAKQTRGSDARVRDSSRDRRKEKDKVRDKEKSKARERESDRDRRKQEKREREGRSRRADAVEKKARHRSNSSSSSGASSSNSDRSRGRLRARRSSRHHISTSSPGRSRKRRASRSRSRSRSPHVKHTHRRNAPSPSHEKSRRSGSKSPVHRRGRG